MTVWMAKKTEDFVKFNKDALEAEYAAPYVPEPLNAAIEETLTIDPPVFFIAWMMDLVPKKVPF